MTRIALITGAEGLLGTEITKVLSATCQCISTTRRSMDVTDRAAVHKVLRDRLPNIVIHCAGYTAVDRAENDREACRLVNVDGTQNVALACESIGCEMLYISTDYVFPGTGTTPFEIDAEECPTNFYGKTKLEGERIAAAYCSKTYIVRTSWLYGAHGSCFASTMLNNAQLPQVRVVDDQIGSPTYAPHLARAIMQLTATNRYGIYHITGEGYCSWAEFARQIFRDIDSQTRVIPVTSEEYQSIAKRPQNSRLSKKCLDDAGIPRLPNWQQGLLEYLQQMNQNH